MSNPTFKVSPRKGPRPVTDLRLPHTQVSQLAPLPRRRALSALLVDELAQLPNTLLGVSLRAPPGSIGFFLQPGCGCGSREAFLLEREFAHVHVEDDGSLHATLSEPLRTEAMEMGWAEPHPLAGAPTVSPNTVMIYAPRNETEVKAIIKLVTASWAYARGEPTKLVSH
jgi:hypothetical protein